MKKLLILAALFISTNATALEVVASGVGNDYNESLKNAKMAALDKVNGAWINGDAYVRNNMFSEKITQYNGGVIRTYTVIKNTPNYVTIIADVVPREKNTMTTNTLNVPVEVRSELEGRQENYKARQEAIKVIDNRERALSFVSDKVEYENLGDKTKVTITGKVSIQPMWDSQYQELIKSAGYFNLESFYKPIYVKVEGYDYDRVVTSDLFRFYDDLNVYKITPYGVVIVSKMVDRVRLTMFVDTNKLKQVNKFEVVFK